MRAFFSISLLALTATGSLLASGFAFTGSFTADDEVRLFTFTVSTSTTVIIQSQGYGGGTNINGTAIPAGGFDTLLTIFKGDGAQAGVADDDPNCEHSQMHNEACLDAYFSDVLPAGAYTLALTLSGNDAIGDLSQGFSQQGNPFFTCPQGFCDFFGNQTNGMWAVQFLNVDAVQTAVPEPATFFPAASLIGVFALAYVRGRSNGVRALF